MVNPSSPPGLHKGKQSPTECCGVAKTGDPSMCYLGYDLLSQGERPALSTRAAKEEKKAWGEAKTTPHTNNRCPLPVAGIWSSLPRKESLWLNVINLL